MQKKLKLLFVFLFIISGLIVNAQEINITGTVTDKETNEYLPGVSIIVKGTNRGVLTDFDGRYRIKANVGEILNFSYLGFENYSYEVKRESSLINVEMITSISQLGEIVVVGYGKQKKESVVGAIGTTTGEILERTGATTNLALALSGQLPGVQVAQSTGQPGNERIDIIVRAQTSWNGSSPLILVDGVERSLNDIDPANVETISVLKDASSTAVFGVKGGNGVILVTTKRGSFSEKPKFTANYNSGFKWLSRAFRPMNSYNTLDYKNKAIERDLRYNPSGWSSYTPNSILNRYRNRLTSDDEWLFPDVNWQEEMLNDVAWNHRLNLGISGGTESVRYFGSISYQHDSDLLKSGDSNDKPYDPGFTYDRINFRSNFDFNISNTTQFSVNLAGIVGMRKQSTYPSNQLYLGVFTLPPNYFPVKYPDGVYGFNPSFSFYTNPIASLRNSGIERVNDYTMTSDFTLTQKLNFITKGLSVSGRLSMDNQYRSEGRNISETFGGSYLSKYIDGIAYLNAQTDEERQSATFFLPATGLNDYDFIVAPYEVSGENNGISKQLVRRFDYQLDLSYDRSFGKHHTDALILFRRIENSKGSVFPNRQQDLTGRVRYDYKNTYLLEFNGSYNGTDKFGPGFRLGFFPSLAVGWNIDKESFMDYDWLDRLKVRYSWGQVGSDNGSDRWAFENRWQIVNGNIANLGQLTGGFFATASPPYPLYEQDVIGNPNVQWEISTKHNLGVEIGVLKNTLSLSLDLWKENRDKIFIKGDNRTVPALFGADPISANLGKTEAEGYELTLDLKKTTPSGLYYWAQAVFTQAKDKIIYIEDAPLLPYNQKQEDFPLNQIKQIIDHGVIQNYDDLYGSVQTDNFNNDKLPGDLMLLDYNGDGLINFADQAPYGYSNHPQKTLSFSVGGEYKGFSAFVQFFGVSNVSRRLVDIVRPFSGDNDVVHNIFSDYWWPDNPNASTIAPRLNSNYTYTGRQPIYDASYLRLKTAEIAYTLKGKKVKSALGMNSVRLFMNGNNLLFWSDLPTDQERGDILFFGQYPNTRRVNFGVNVQF
ncbi:SusC/RagA family TonB-linked outer membrane protein [uncultured Polaribacter sp.]|uniref:SusC/RagA family TonB-linked outer membrane protein n=1 Tax=uncultured Polaribacter sp. TaxID=174711 RepID=UPI0026112996|nr:SusC/RagA family TonB-linked outer membrane protein [uncultured Polaribacter sp.]